MQTERLMITTFDLSFVDSTQRMSVEESNRKYIPDEVFETLDDARECIEFLMDAYEGAKGPFVYPIVTKHDRVHIGHIQAVSTGDGKWEIGYHIGEQYQNHGYATEAVKAFTPFIMGKLNISELYGICKATNTASYIVLERCGYRLLGEVMGRYLGEETLIRRYVYVLTEGRGAVL